MILFIITGCSSTTNDDDKFIYDYPVIIEISDEQFHDNLQKIACKQAIYYLDTNGIDKSDITIGDVIHRYGFVNGRLIELTSPYYVPIFKDGMPLFYVLVYNGKTSDYASEFVGGNYCKDISDDQFYTSILEFTDLKDHSYEYYPYVYDLSNGFIVIYDGNYSKIYTNDYQQDSEVRTIDESTINYLKDDINDYKTYSLDELSSDVMEVYIISEEVKDNDYRKLVKDALKEEFGFNLSYSVKEQLDVFKLSYNTDLSISLVKQNGINGIYPIYHNGKYYNIAQFAYNDYAGLYCQFVGDYSILAYNLNEELFDKFNEEGFVIIVDEIESGFCLVSDDDLYCYNMSLDDKVLEKVRNFLEDKK